MRSSLGERLTRPGRPSAAPLRLACAAAVAVVVVASPLLAAPAVVSGPAAPPSGGAYLSPTLAFTPGSSLNNAGSATGWAWLFDASFQFKGDRGVRWGSDELPSQLPTLGENAVGFGTSRGYAINSAGTVIGHANRFDELGNDVGSRAVRWSPDGTAVELGHLGTSGGYALVEAYAINDLGTGVGFAQAYHADGGSLGTRAVRWAAGQTAATQLGGLGTTASGFADGRAYDLSPGGTAVGFVTRHDAAGTSLGKRAVRWAPGTTAAIELDTIGTDANGFADAEATVINAAGQIAGVADRFDAAGLAIGRRAVRWNAVDTTAVELDALRTRPDGFSLVRANDIDSSGTVVGWANQYDDAGQFRGIRAVRWAAGGSAVTELGGLGVDAAGATSGEARAINASGTAVGYAQKFSPTGQDLGRRAVYWLAGQTDAVDLTALLGGGSPWLFTNAMGISDTGWISGSGTYNPGTAEGANAAERLYTILVPAAGTYGRGDGNFDTRIDFDDLLLLAQHYGQASGGSVNVGDFDLSGAVDFDDLLTLAQHYGSAAAVALPASTSAAFASDWALAQSIVPEPALASVVLVTLASLRRRR